MLPHGTSGWTRNLNSCLLYSRVRVGWRMGEFGIDQDGGGAGRGDDGEWYRASVCTSGIQRDFARRAGELSAARDGDNRQEPGPRGQKREVDGGGEAGSAGAAEAGDGFWGGCGGRFCGGGGAGEAGNQKRGEVPGRPSGAGRREFLQRHILCFSFFLFGD